MGALSLAAAVSVGAYCHGETTQEATAAGSGSGSDAVCLGCHSSLNQTFRDPITGRTGTYQIDATKFEASNHGGVHCVTCHGSAVEAFPHAENARERAKQCSECHPAEFARIKAQFQRSVHFKKAPRAFTCNTCHDPHVFEVASRMHKASDIVVQDNSMCLNCHGSDKRFSEVSTAKRPDLMAIHDWLPNPKLHWRAVRCVECHTPLGPKLSHEVVGANRAERRCAQCHSATTALRATLYKHLISQERERMGFINTVILGEAYVIGATRNRVLDLASFILLGLVVGAIVAHGAGRIIAAARRRKRNG